MTGADGNHAERDYFVEQDGQRFAGTHLLVELWQAQHLADERHLAEMLRDAAAVCGATLLDLHVHRFGDSGGITGVAVLAESHITIHTWPEHGYAAIDIFMCGVCDPRAALPVLRAALRPGTVEVSAHKRGVAPRLAQGCSAGT